MNGAAGVLVDGDAAALLLPVALQLLGQLAGQGKETGDLEPVLLDGTGEGHHERFLRDVDQLAGLARRAIVRNRTDAEDGDGNQRQEFGEASSSLRPARIHDDGGRLEAVGDHCGPGGEVSIPAIQETDRVIPAVCLERACRGRIPNAAVVEGQDQAQNRGLTASENRALTCAGVTRRTWLSSLSENCAKNS